MLYEHYHKFLAGYWRCESSDYVFDCYIREDGFHIGVIPENIDKSNKLIPMPLWLSAHDSGEITVSNSTYTNFWTRNWYRDGNRFVMTENHKTATKSISRRISFSDIDHEAVKIIKKYCIKFPSKP